MLLFVFGLFMATSYVATDVYIPSLPEMTMYFNSDISVTKLTISIYLFSFGIGQLVSGFFSEYCGRLKPAFLGILLFVFGSLINILSFEVWIVFVGRIVQGIGAGFMTAMARAMMNDFYKGKYLSHALSKMAIIMAIFPTIAPILGSFIQKNYGFRGNFVVMFVFGVFNFFLAKMVLFETKLENKKKPRLKVLTEAKSLTVSKDFLISSVCSGIAFGFIISYLTLLSYLLQIYFDYEITSYAKIAFVLSLGVFSGMLISKILLHFLKPLMIIWVSFLSMTFSTIFALLFSTFAPDHLKEIFLIFGFILISMSACVLPNAPYVALSQHTEISGISSSLYGVIQILIAFFISSIISFFPSNSMYFYLTFSLLLAMTGYFITRKLCS